MFHGAKIRFVIDFDVIAQACCGFLKMEELRKCNALLDVHESHIWAVVIVVVKGLYSQLV